MAPHGECLVGVSAKDPGGAARLGILQSPFGDFWSYSLPLRIQPVEKLRDEFALRSQLLNEQMQAAGKAV